MKSFLIFLCFVSLSAQAANLTSVVFEGVSEKKSRASSRKELMERAVAETSLDYIRQMIGEEKTERNRQLIKNFVIKQSGKYVTKIKGENIQKENNKYKMSFRLDLDLDSLKRILLRNGLLYEMEGTSKVLPFISWSDKVSSEAYSWWTDNPVGASSVGLQVIKTLHLQLQTQLSGKGFYSVLPIESNFQKLVPPGFDGERMNNSDMLFLGDYFGAPIVLKGVISAKAKSTFGNNYELNVKIVAYQSLNGRVIGEVTRSFETDNASFNLAVNRKWLQVVGAVAGDLSSQVFNSWQKGTFGSSLIKITLQGDLLYKDVVTIKERLGRIGDIRAIRERLFEPGSVTFEVDTSKESTQLVKIIQGIGMGPVKLEVDEVKASEVLFDVRRVN